MISRRVKEAELCSGSDCCQKAGNSMMDYHRHLYLEGRRNEAVSSKEAAISHVTWDRDVWSFYGLDNVHDLVYAHT